MTPVSPTTGQNGFTARDDLPLFPESLIPEEVVESLPDGYTLRPLRRSDYSTGEQGHLLHTVTNEHLGC